MVFFSFKLARKALSLCDSFGNETGTISRTKAKDVVDMADKFLNKNVKTDSFEQETLVDRA